MTRNKLLLLLFIIISSGCVDEIEVFKKSTSTLIVEGLVTDQPGIHRVTLGFSKVFGERASYFHVEEAIVKIVDDLGNEELLTYKSFGDYITSDNFKGEVGRSYHVDITLKNGSNYQSVPEKLIETPEIDEVSYRIDGKSVDFFVDFNDDPHTNNFYRWRFTGTYQVVAALTLTGSDSEISAIVNNCYLIGRTPTLVPTPICWVTTFDHEFLKIGRDQFFNGRNINDLQIYTLKIDSTRFNYGYIGEIKQYSMTKRAFEYWKAIEEQIGNNGTIFEVANYQIKGNIYSPEDENTLVLGYFGASAVSSKMTFVDDFIGLAELESCATNSVGCVPERCIDCRKYLPSAREQKPSYWPY